LGNFKLVRLAHIYQPQMVALLQTLGQLSRADIPFFPS
jgi:hypothetical protein